ncbi:MAG: hypothetical protein QW801_05040 [Candidatus Caldarchaeum sp.]
MSLLFITNQESDIPLALHLAKRGVEITFYSPNPYIASQALKHSIKTHYTVSKPEFIKLCAEGMFKTVHELPNTAGEVWICVNTMKDGEDTYADAENLLTTAAQKIAKTKALTISGLTKPGEASRLINLFHSMSKSPECPSFFIGSPQTISEKTPSWSSDGKKGQTPESISLFNPCFFNTVESAEDATISMLVCDAVRRTALLHFPNWLEILQKCLNDEFFLRPEHLDVLRFMKSSAKIDEWHSRFFTSFYRGLVKEVSRRESEMVADVVKLARKSGKTIRVLIVCFEEDVAKRLQLSLAKKNVKITCINEGSLESKGVEVCKGFDCVILATRYVALLKEFMEACKRMWFIPTI